MVEPLQAEEPLPVEELLPVEEPHFRGEPQGLEEPEQLEPTARPCAVQTGPGPLSAGALQAGTPPPLMNNIDPPKDGKKTYS